MIYKEILPPMILKEYVRHFWYIEQKAETGLATPFRLMADGFPSLIFQYKNQFRDYNNPSYTFPKTLLFGHTYNFRNLLIDGDFSVFGVAFFPYTPTLLYNLPGKEFANTLLNGDDIFSKEDNFLEERIAMAKHHDERVKILADLLINKLSSSSQFDLVVKNSVQLLVQPNSICNIEALTKYLGISCRQFERRFQQHIGLSPKLFSRIVRFQNTLKYSPSQSVSSLTDTAFLHGYADQAHFTREFKSFSGINPKHYFRKQAECAENLLPL